jgi:uncharacterized repeat protein (TIGR03803 family)
MNTVFRVRLLALTIGAILLASTARASITAAGNDSYNSNSGGNGAIVVAAPGVLTNDTSSLGPTAQKHAALVTAPTHGTLILNDNGSFSYFATPGYVGTDTFVYRASDGSATTRNATVTLTIPLRTNDDSFAVPSDTLVVTANVMTNDKVQAGQTTTVSLLSGPASGNLSLTSTGSFTYTANPSVFFNDPQHGLVGSASFTYRVTASPSGATSDATVNLANAFAVVHVFHVSPIDPNTFPESLAPFGMLVLAPDGKFYGTTNGDGGYDGGNIFRVEADNSLTIIKRFTKPSLWTGDPSTDPGACNPNCPTTAPYPGDAGSYPTAIARTSDGSLIGTTEMGGDWNQGTIYKLTFSPSGGNPVFSTLHSFNCSAGEGLDPWGQLVEGPDGAMYGRNGLDNPDPLTNCWGSRGFKVNKDGTGFAVVAKFDDPNIGYYQLGPVAIGADLTMYGTSKFAVSGRVIFKAPPGVAPSVLHLLDSNHGEGAAPASGLIRGIDGALYGTTEVKDIDDQSGAYIPGGTIFRITEDGQFATLYTFDATTGGLYQPSPPMRKGGDGKLYGATFAGGRYGAGGLYQFDLPTQYGGTGGANGTFTVIHEFNPDTEGFGAYGLPGVGSDHHVYGSNAAGGADGAGTLFGPLESVTVANSAPVANVSYTASNPDLGTINSPTPVEATSPSGASVTLSSLGSSDDDFDPLTFAWTQSGATGFTATTTSQAPFGLNYSTATGTFPIGTTPVKLTVDDGQPHTIPPTITDRRSMTINVVVRHTLPPVVTVTPTAAGGIVEATGPAGATATYSVSAVDRVDGTEPASRISCSPASGSTFPLGATTVTCKASDSANNIGTGTVVITVRDTTPPTVTTSGNVTVEATGPSGATASFTASANDTVAGAIVPTCTPVSGSTFPVGATTVTCLASDPSGNVGRATLTVTVRDTRPPTVTTSGNQTLEATGPNGAVATFTASGSDIVSGTLPATCTPASGSTFALGTTTVTCSATDGAGNKGSSTLTITVRDTTPPTVTGTSVTVEATSASGATATFTATATDLVSGTRPTTCTPASGTVFALGTTTVTCTATDAAGNKGTGTLTVTVRDTTPPSIQNVPANMTVYVASGTSTTVTYTQPNATDAVDGTDAVVCTPASGSSFPLGTTTVNCTSTDRAGNTSTASFTVTVKVNVAPTCSAATASPAVLWPPYHQFVPIGINGVTSSDGSPANIQVTSIFQDEPTSGLGDGDAPIDGWIFFGIPIVRAERSGLGNGRVYHIRFTATGSNGATCNGDVTVGVPHDFGGQAIDDGPKYDSTQSPPDAANDTAATVTGVPTTIAVLANDGDPLGLALTVIAVTPPAHGTVVINGNGTITYTPAAGFTGTDTFSYTIRNSQGNTDTATVTVTVSKHFTGDGCDHDRRSWGHWWGDGCDHDRGR